MPTPLPRVSYRHMTRVDFGWEDPGSSRARTAASGAAEAAPPLRTCMRCFAPTRASDASAQVNASHTIQDPTVQQAAAGTWKRSLRSGSRVSVVLGLVIPPRLAVPRELAVFAHLPRRLDAEVLRPS